MFLPLPLLQVVRDRRGVAQGVSLTGWVAMLGIAAMVVLIVYGIMMGYRKFRGIPGDRDYTLVGAPDWCLWKGGEGVGH